MSEFVSGVLQAMVGGILAVSSIPLTFKVLDYLDDRAERKERKGAK